MTPTNPPDKYELCTEEDDFLCDKTIWIASLSNGVTVYQDDDRSNLKEPSAWKRLGFYISENCPEINIVGMQLKFRSHIVELPSNARGYYFAHGMSKTTDDSVERGYLVCGSVDTNILRDAQYTEPVDDIITCEWYSIPELIVAREQNRCLSQLQAPFLILNPT